MVLYLSESAGLKNVCRRKNSMVLIVLQSCRIMAKRRTGEEKEYYQLIYTEYQKNDVVFSCP